MGLLGVVSCPLLCHLALQIGCVRHRKPTCTLLFALLLLSCSLSSGCCPHSRFGPPLSIHKSDKGPGGEFTNNLVIQDEPIQTRADTCSLRLAVRSWLAQDDGLVPTRENIGCVILQTPLDRRLNHFLEAATAPHIWMAATS